MLPATPHLEGVVQHLADQGDHRSLVTLVETWAELGEPSIPARLALARSLLALRCFDRAWARVRDLVEAPEPNLDALQIAAEMFLLRGWPNQARKILQRGLDRIPHHPALIALDRRAQEPMTTLDEGAADSDSAPVPELLRVAEQYMARGSMVRARSLLERVRRRAPDQPRASELLWAMDGVFVTSEPLDALCRRWGPRLPGSMDGEGDDEPENTESARVEDLRGGDSEDSFPQLFRHLGVGPRPQSPSPHSPSPHSPRPPEGAPELELLPNTISEFDSSEQTAVTSMAELGAGEPEPLLEVTDAGEDTQIARVMSKKGVQQVSGVVHLGNTSIDSKFNLEEYRREMGMTASGIDSDFGGPEDEDESVVILTGQDHEDSPETSDTGRLDLDPEYQKAEARAKAKLSSGEEAWAAPRPGKEAKESPEQVEGETERPVTRTVGPPTRHPPHPPPLDVTPPPRELATVPTQEVVLPSSLSVDVTAELTPQEPMFPRGGPYGSSWGLGPNPLGAWPYWIAALSTVLMMFVMIFAVLSVVFAIL